MARTGDYLYLYARSVDENAQIWAVAVVAAVADVVDVVDDEMRSPNAFNYSVHRG